MARSEFQRSPQGWMLNFSHDLSWNYCHVLVRTVLLESGNFYNVNDHYDYVKQYTDTMILESGNVIGYRMEDNLFFDISNLS